MLTSNASPSTNEMTFKTESSTAIVNCPPKVLRRIVSLVAPLSTNCNLVENHWMPKVARLLMYNIDTVIGTRWRLNGRLITVRID